MNNDPWYVAGKHGKKPTTEDFNAIRHWMDKQPHLPKVPDYQIILFLNASKYNIQECKTLIENYYTMRTLYKHYFSQRNPSDPKIQQTLNVTSCVIYGKDINNRPILWSKLLDTDPNVYHPTSATKLMFMVYDIDQLENGPMPGYTLVLDGKGITMNHAMRCSLTNAKQVISYVQTASTIVIDKVFILNLTPAAAKVMYIVKPFIRSELLDKITICTEQNLNVIAETIQETYIPKDYNGNAPSISELQEECKRKLEKYSDWFSTEETLRVTDSKRIADLQSSDELKFGLEGSFKTLQID